MISKNTSVALIDGDYLLWIATYPQKITNEDGEITYIDKTFEEVKDSFDSILESILAATEATHYIGFLSTKSFRKGINPEYKAQRSSEKPKFFSELREYVREKFEQVDNLEADDCVSILKNKISNSFIVSNDKDILNLVGRHYNPQKQEWIETSAEEAYRFFWGSMIIGDSSDNIKGIPGKGKAFVNKLFEEQTNNLRDLVFKTYLEHFGEYLGIQEFYKNYMCLKILDDYDIEIPEFKK